MSVTDTQGQVEPFDQPKSLKLQESVMVFNETESDVESPQLCAAGGVSDSDDDATESLVSSSYRLSMDDGSTSAARPTSDDTTTPETDGTRPEGEENNDKWRTKPCRFWERDACEKGDNCPYIHDKDNLWSDQRKQKQSKSARRRARRSRSSSGSKENDRGSSGDGKSKTRKASTGDTVAMHGGAVDTSGVGTQPHEQAPLPRHYRTTPCRFYLDGCCNRGDACTFAHPPLQPHNTTMYNPQVYPQLYSMNPNSQSMNVSVPSPVYGYPQPTQQPITPSPQQQHNYFSAAAQYQNNGMNMNIPYNNPHAGPQANGAWASGPPQQPQPQQQQAQAEYLNQMAMQMAQHQQAMWLYQQQQQAQQQQAQQQQAQQQQVHASQSQMQSVPMQPHPAWAAGAVPNNNNNSNGVPEWQNNQHEWPPLEHETRDRRASSRVSDNPGGSEGGHDESSESGRGQRRRNTGDGILESPTAESMLFPVTGQ